MGEHLGEARTNGERQCCPCGSMQCHAVRQNDIKWHASQFTCRKSRTSMANTTQDSAAQALAIALVLVLGLLFSSLLLLLMILHLNVVVLLLLMMLLVMWCYPATDASTVECHDLVLAVNVLVIVLCSPATGASYFLTATVLRALPVLPSRSHGQLNTPTALTASQAAIRTGRRAAPIPSSSTDILRTSLSCTHPKQQLQWSPQPSQWPPPPSHLHPPKQQLQWSHPQLPSQWPPEHPQWHPHPSQQS